MVDCLSASIFECIDTVWLERKARASGFRTGLLQKISQLPNYARVALGRRGDS